MDSRSDRQSRVRLLVVVVLVLGMVGSGAVAGVAGVSPAIAQPEVPDPEADDAEDEEVEDDEGDDTDEGGEDEAADEDEEEVPVGVANGDNDDEDDDAEDADEAEDDEDDPTADLESPYADDGEDSGGGGFNGGGMTGGSSDVTDEEGEGTVGQALNAIAVFLAEASVNVVQWVLGGSYELVVGTPVPENAGWLGIFGEPTNEPFATLFADLHETWLFPLTLSFFVLALLISGSVLPFSGFIGKYSASRWVVLAFATVLAMSLSWPIVTALHLGSDTVAATIAPSGDEITDSDGIATLVASAGPLAAGLYITNGIKMIVYALIYGMRYFLLLMVLPYIFGLALAVSLFAPWRKLRSFASGVLWLHVSLLLIPIVTAILFRGAYLIDWSFGFEGMANLLLIMGLLVAAIAIPIWMMYKATTMTGMVAGAAAGAGASLAARDSYKPKSIGYAKSAPGKAISAGRSIRNAPNRAREMSSSAADRATALRNGDLGALRRNFTPSSSSSGGTQAERKRIATDGGEKRVVGHFRRHNREGGEE
jgi:hypothetical protein